MQETKDYLEHMFALKAENPEEYQVWNLSLSTRSNLAVETSSRRSN
jgi:hypothetical protein